MAKAVAQAASAAKQSAVGAQPARLQWIVEDMDALREQLRAERVEQEARLPRDRAAADRADQMAEQARRDAWIEQHRHCAWRDPHRIEPGHRAVGGAGADLRRAFKVGTVPGRMPAIVALHPRAFARDDAGRHAVTGGAAGARKAVAGGDRE